MDWARDGRDWPHHQRSRFVVSHGRRWHVQRWPAPAPGAPELLLLHGTGASTHSWRALAPLLAEAAGVTAIDLPGHGFSDPAPAGGTSLPGMARGVAALLCEIGVSPALRIGHSAGAAIAVQMALDSPGDMQPVVSLNGALLPLHGLAGRVFSPLAKLLAGNRVVPQLFAWRAAEAQRLRRLVESTGSRIDEAGIALYGRLVGDAEHVAGALAMMAHWDLQALAERLPRLHAPLHLIDADGDRTLPAGHADRVAALLPPASRTMLSGLGHLAHEEDPQRVLAVLRPMLDAAIPLRRPQPDTSQRSA
jgi:magnesium chelatase accessory protein